MIVIGGWKFFLFLFFFYHFLPPKLVLISARIGHQWESATLLVSTPCLIVIGCMCACAGLWLVCESAHLPYLRNVGIAYSFFFFAILRRP
jgi:hypothetical protein